MYNNMVMRSSKHKEVTQWEEAEAQAEAEDLVADQGEVLPVIPVHPEAFQADRIAVHPEEAAAVHHPECQEHLHHHIIVRHTGQ